MPGNVQAYTYVEDIFPRVWESHRSNVRRAGTCHPGLGYRHTPGQYLYSYMQTYNGLRQTVSISIYNVTFEATGFSYYCIIEFLGVVLNQDVSYRHRLPTSLRVLLAEIST